MASITRRGTKWCAKLIKKNFPLTSKTFKTQVAAKAWARRVEASKDNGTCIVNCDSRSVSIDQLIDEAVQGVNTFSTVGGSVQGPKLSQLNQLKEYFRGLSIHDFADDDLVHPRGPIPQS